VLLVLELGNREIQFAKEDRSKKILKKLDLVSVIALYTLKAYGMFYRLCRPAGMLCR